ncbi:MAG: extensin family protein [Alphaproteobacteria bacterium]|nr:extensin family protein [Alphaproteobacteria bacterium]
MPKRLLAIAIMLLGVSAAHSIEPAPGSVPVPQTRPTERNPGAETEKSAEKPANWSTPQDRAAADEDLELCLAELRKSGARFKRAEPIREETVCGELAPVVLTGIRSIKLSQPATLTCQMARAVSHWVLEVAAPMATLFVGAELTGLQTGTSYQCRRQNGSGIGKLSEHAFANGLDVHGFLVEGKSPVAVISRAKDPDENALFQAAVRGGACAYFTTVLGPGTNDAHDNHFHLDLRPRRGGYRLCE